MTSSSTTLAERPANEPSLFQLLSWPSFFKFLLEIPFDLLGIITEEQPKFDLVREFDAAGQHIQLRKYAPKIVASLVYQSTGDVRYDDQEGFRPLAKYIFGFNKSKGEVAMTTPVKMASEEIAMTTPVKMTDAPRQEIAMTTPVKMAEEVPSGNGGLPWKRMEFTMPAQYTMATLPAPEDPRIKLEQVESETVAIIRFSGNYPMGAARDAKYQELIAALTEAGVQVKEGAKPFFLGYNSPYCVPFLKTNEVGVAIKE